MRLSSKEKKIPAGSPGLGKDLPLIAGIPFEDLEKPAAKVVEITPIACENCGAVLLDLERVKDDPNIGIHFKCAYCGAINKLAGLPAGYISGDDVEFILERAPVDTPATGERHHAGGELFGAVIDVSGSMAGGKLAAVKHSLAETIKDMKVDSPGTAFFLVTFESTVKLYKSPRGNPVKIVEDKHLRSEDKLGRLVHSIFKDASLPKMKDSADEWVSVVESLRSLDMTALGPALVTAIQAFLASGTGGRLLLLTDGLANVGMGRLEGGISDKARKFYGRLAKTCLDNGIVVDIIGVGGGNELALDILGQLPEQSGGELYFVGQEEIDATFGELGNRRFAGRDVSMRVFTPGVLDINTISGISSTAEKASRGQEIKVGSVTPDREALIRFDVKEDVSGMEEVPVQVQLEFKDASGNRKLRVFKTTLRPETDEDAYKKSYDPRPLAMMQVQEAGARYGKGDADSAREVLNKAKEFFQQQAGGMSAEEMPSTIEIIDDEIARLQEFEEEKRTKAARSFTATVGQARKRVSLKKKLEELESRKKA